MRKIFEIGVCLIAIVSIFGCHPDTVTIVTEVPVLRASSIYNEDSVYQYMEKYKDTNKEIATSYYKQSTNLENTNLPKAIYCLKRSITLQPTLSKYRKLAALLYKAGTYNELRPLYYLLVYKLSGYGNKYNREYLFGKPDEDLICEYVTNNILAFKTVWGDDGDNEGLTKELGIDIKDLQKKVLSDNRIKLDTSSEDYKDIVLQFLSDSEMVRYMKTENSFKTFLGSIKDTSSVFEINKEHTSEFDYTIFHDMEGPGPEDMNMVTLYKVYLKESKDMYNDIVYNYEHRFKINDTINAILYSVDTSEIACPKDMRHIYHRLAVYGRKANIISDMIVANQSGEQLSTLNYNYGKFIVTYYKRFWEKPYKKGEFDNHLQKIEETDVKTFQIQPDGKIQEILVVNGNTTTP